MLEQRGSAPRKWKNMLVFLAATKRELEMVEEEARHYRAWLSIKEDTRVLNLDVAQIIETDNNLKRSSETIDMRLHNAWNYLLVPAADKDNINDLAWDVSLLTGKEKTCGEKACNKLAQDEQILESWSPSLLLMELDNLLWKDARHLEIRKLWDYMCSYYYLPRLKNYEVLEETISRGVESGQYFAYAEALGDNGYIDLKLGERCRIDKNGMLVRRDVALEQLGREKTAPVGGLGEIPRPRPRPEPGDEAEPPVPPTQLPEPPKATRFYLNTRLDSARINRDINSIMTEILNHIAVDGTLEIRLEAQAISPEGFQRKTIRTATENCKTLKIDNFGFEED